MHMYIFYHKLKNGEQCFMKMLKWFVRSYVALLNKMLFVDLRCFILAPCYNLTMMMESVFSFFHLTSMSYF